MRELTVNVAGLTFSGMRGPFAIGPDGLDGWDDGVEMRVSDVPRQNNHGSYDLPVYAGSRIVSISGYVLAQSVGELINLRSRLTGLLAGGKVGRITVTEEGVVTWADCRLAAQTRFTKRADGITGDYQIQLWCPDGRRFGEVRRHDMTPGVSASAFHYGNAEALPAVQVNGPLTGGFTITHPAGAYTALGDLTAGAWARVDFNTARLTLNGNDRTDLVTRADICPVPPGGTAQFSLNRGTGYVEVLDTYM